MAKRITGCDWAYEVIEGMDQTLHEMFPEARKNVSRRSSIQQRSGFSEDQSAAKGDEILRKPYDEKKPFSHLSKASFKFYEDFHRKKITKELLEKEPQAPRPKIIVIDSCWDLDDKLMPQKVAFATEECEKVNDLRRTPWGRVKTGLRLKRGDAEYEIVKDKNPYITPKGRSSEDEYVYYENGECERKHGSSSIKHGVACVGVLRVSNPDNAHGSIIWDIENKDNREAPLWNLSSRADIILLPKREYGKIKPSDCAPTFKQMTEFGIINSEQSAAFETHDTIALLNEAMEKDASKSLELLELSILELVTSEFECGNYHSPLQKLITARQQELGTQDRIVANKTVIRELLQAVNRVLDESGLVATLDVLRRASKAGHFGRGDTVVIPLQVDLWKDNKEIREDLLDPISRNHKASNFFVRQSNSEDGGKKTNIFDSIKNIDLPVIIYKKVEELIRQLTSEHRISVIISAGNSHIDLGQIDIAEIDKVLPTQRFADPDLEVEDRKLLIEKENRRLFRGRGCHCGAIIVGSGVVDLSQYWLDPLGKRILNHKWNEKTDKHQSGLKSSLLGKTRDHRTSFANYGLCIDASGRGSIKDLLNIQNRIVDNATYEHWKGASIASMIAAACLANIQHIRMLKDFNFLAALASNNEKAKPLGEIMYPLKPYEARAHIQQWRSTEVYSIECIEDMMGAPPDIKAWLEGSCAIDSLQIYADKGKKVVAQYLEKLEAAEAQP